MAVPSSLARQFSISCSRLISLARANPMNGYGVRAVSSSSTYFNKTEWTYKKGPFDSVYVDFREDVPLSGDFMNRFANFLVDVRQEQDNLKAVLCFIPMRHCHIFHNLIELGFTVHHAKTEYAALAKWMVEDTPSKIPAFSSHMVGVSGYVFDEENMKTLVVQDKGKTKRWKFPGGFAEPGESISKTCVREVEEETGISSEFRSILTFREQHGMRFGQTDLYFICRLHPLSFTINKCDEEIEKCEWIPIEDLLDDKIATPLTQLVTRLVMKGHKEGFDTVDLISSSMKGWVPPYADFQVYHPRVETPE